MRLHHNPVISFADESLCHLVPVSVRLFSMALRLTLIPNTQHCNNKKSLSIITTIAIVQINCTFNSTFYETSLSLN